MIESVSFLHGHAAVHLEVKLYKSAVPNPTRFEFVESTRCWFKVL